MAIRGLAARTIWLKASAVLLLGALGTTWSVYGRAEPVLLVPTARLQTRGLNASLEWDGTIQAVKQSTVAAQVPGNIIALLVKAGDSVKAGQVLARIDERETQAGLSRSQADLAQAEAQLTNARLQWERSQALKAQGFISGAALDSAQAQWKAAQAAMAAAQSGRTQAALARSFATVTAPFDGKVLSTQADVGDLATPGRPILTLYAPHPLRAVVQVPASQADRLRMVKGAEVAVPGGADQGATSWLKAIRITSLPGADPMSQTVEWRLDLPDVNVLPGQAVRVRLTGEPTSPAADTSAAIGLSAPAGAVLQRGELTAVYVVREGHFVLQAVRIAPTANASSEVTLLSGVKPGDVIALDAIKAGLSHASPMKP